MKTINNILIISLSLTLMLSCTIEDGENLNGPTKDSVSEDLSRGELDQTVAGALSDMRIQLATQTDAQSVAGREYWRFQSSDPRWTADLMTGKLDNNTFYTTNPYAARYATIKNINVLLEGLGNSSAEFLPAEIAAIKGFVNTIKAHELLMVLNQQFQNGIRTDVADPDNLGGFENYEQAITTIFEILTTAATDLSNGGDEFPFSVPSGFSDLKSILTPDDFTPDDFLKFNNALLARVEAYRGNYEAVNRALENSFMDMTGDLSKGVYFTFSLTGADIANPLFFAKNSTVANARIAHPSFIADAEAGDERLKKVVFREVENKETMVIEPNPITQDGLTGTHDVFIYDSNVARVSIIKNEELILLAAEANHISDPMAAVAAINIIRVAAKLPVYSGGLMPDDLVDEILKQRRYSLFAEGGHRWIDLRRFNRLEELPLDRTGDAVFMQFPVPANENK